jgi:hypothetical protein
MLSFFVIFPNVLCAFIDMKTETKCVIQELIEMSTNPVIRMGAFFIFWNAKTSISAAITQKHSTVLYLFAAREGRRTPFSRSV